MHRLPKAARAALAVYLMLGLTSGTAKAAYQLQWAEGAEPTKGLSFLPEISGIRTQPAPVYKPVRASGTAVGRPVTIREPEGDFWRALADCESPSGASGRYLGYFQFHPGTWQATGGGDLGSYEHQKARAQQWASKVNPGSTAGWPVCWHRARAKVGYAP